MADDYIKRSDAINAYKTSRSKNNHRTTEGSLVHIQEHNHILHILDKLPSADVVEIPKSGIGDLSDGYHTFNELYHHRAVLFSVICNLMPEKAWKSKLHDTGDMYEGMFIVGIETPNGQATYHYDTEPYWDMFRVKELERAPKYDGHTPQDAIERIAGLRTERLATVHGKWIEHFSFDCWHYDCSVCNEGFATKDKEKYLPRFCEDCGAMMDSVPLSEAEGICR